MNAERYYWVYILANKIGGTLYIGVTNNLIRRVYEHRMGAVPGFTKQYGVHRLVYFEQHTDIVAAIQREKRLKRWNRAWKVKLVETLNRTGMISTRKSPALEITGSSAFADDDRRRI